MKLNVSYHRKHPDTINGDQIEIVYRYSSFDQREIDAVENWARKDIGLGITANLEITDLGKEIKNDQ